MNLIEVPNTVGQRSLRGSEKTMGAPINVKLRKPTIAISDWQEQAQNWTTLNTEVGGNPDFYPLTVKFAYLVGVIHDICECVARLLNDKDFAKRTSYIPAYALFASGIEILGRCVKGESKPQKSTLKAGLQWLADPRFPEYSRVSKSTVLISTTQRKYTVNELEQLRNFAAHGQATSTFYRVDYEVLSRLRPPSRIRRLFKSTRRTARTGAGRVSSLSLLVLGRSRGDAPGRGGSRRERGDLRV